MAFFKDLGNKISNKSREWSEKAKIYSEKSSLNTLIRDEEYKIDSQYKAIGKICYEKYKDSPDEEFKEAFSVIQESLEKIQQAQEELDKIKNRYNCPHCGAPFKHDSRFCSKCGAELPQYEPENEAPEIPEGAQKCPKCNNILKSDALFCNECGTKLESQDNSTVEEKTEAELLTAPVYNSKEESKENKEQEEAAPAEASVNAETVNETDEKELVFTKKCSKCGNDMCEDDMFCNECGAKYE